jgi:adenylate cyclase
VLFAGSILSWSTKIYENDTFMVVLLVYASGYSLISLFRAIIKKVRGALFLGIGFGFFLVSLIAITILGAVAGSIEISSGNTLIAKILGVVILLDIVSIPITMSIYQAWIFARLNKDLSVQLLQVQELSATTIKQEQEKKQLLENQNAALEGMVKDRTAQLSAEKQKSDDLLLNILPEEIATELKQNGQSAARQYNHVSVLFTDFVNFTGLSEQMTATDLVAEIHRNFTAFDDIIERHGLEKIKTIGDAYLAVCGMPNETPDHAQRVVNAAMEINTYMQVNKGKFQIRIGIHSGPVVAGIVGVKKYAYDIWGDTVNTASRMESTSEAGKINISAATYELIKREFTCTHRGKINAKNKGEVDMYFVEGKTENHKIG